MSCARHTAKRRGFNFTGYHVNEVSNRQSQIAHQLRMITIPIIITVDDVIMSSTKMDRFVFIRHLCIIENSIHFFGIERTLQL